RAGFEITAHVDLDDSMPGDRERAVYRLVQEALNNVVKHAGAQRGSVEARTAAGAARIVIEDDGGGLHWSEAGARRGPPGGGDAGARRDARGRALGGLPSESRLSDRGQYAAGRSSGLSARLRGPGLDHPVGDREADQLGPRLDVELLQQLRPVDLDRPDAQEQL